jgi:Xaa-Pro aminopeptidase
VGVAVLSPCDTIHRWELRSNGGGVFLTALQAVRAALSRASIQGIIITRPENRFYCSGFTGSAGALLITPDTALLLTDFRYTQQAAIQAPDFTVVRTDANPMNTLSASISALSLPSIAFESDYSTVSWLVSLKERSPEVELIPTDSFVENVRAVKRPEEIEKLKVASRLADDCFSHILPFIKAGVRELDIALEMEFFMRKKGATALAFDVIAASGERSSMPHGRASEKVIETGDLLTLDFGAVVDGYCSDLTRTVVIGTPTVEQRKVYDTVKKAQGAAVEAIAPGLSCRAADGVARKIITDAGFGKYFGHGLGHGVGVVVHESPRLSPSAPAEAVLVAGNVTSIEPGIYMPGWGGVRIEDLLVVTDAGFQNLNRSTKELIEIG